MTNPASDDWIRLPQELRDSAQWCVAGPDRAPYVVSQSGEVRRASVTNSSHLRSFQEVASYAAQHENTSIGFVLTYEDPWTCIDLDVKNEWTQRAKGEQIDPSKWTTEEEIKRYVKIVETFDSYTEISSSGFGLHIWVRGRIGAGARRDGVEVYSQERFIVSTGRVYRNKPIEDRQGLLDLLVEEIRGKDYHGPGALVEIEEDWSDAEIFERAIGAANAEKFNKLCAGEWKADFPSQSEADLALMSMLAFYSKSNEQCRRIFRCTALGQREKATKNDRYLNYTLEVIRGRQAREAIIDNHAKSLAQKLIAEQQGSSYADVTAGQAAIQATKRADVDATISWPPGLAGAIAAFIYNSAPRPVKEVAIVAALGFLAGVCGKAYAIPQSGLNLYVILVARSGVGKEAMHSGLSLISSALRDSIPASTRFLDFNDFASGPALTKACSLNASFVNVAGEFGRKLKRMADEHKADGPMQSLRTVMTNLYQKSGPGSMTGGITYSNKEENVASATGVAFSLIGETTPGTLFESLTPSMMEDGFLSRFIIVDYIGDRPALNERPERKMHPALLQALHGLCAQSLTLISRYSTQDVYYNDEAYAILNNFDKKCDAAINSTNDEAQRQMWNRAHLKVCRIAALLAVADNWINPVVTKEHADWALELILRDIQIMKSRMESGDVGVDDASRERKMVVALRQYLSSKGGLSDAYGVPDAMRKDGIVSKRYLQMRLSRVAQFMAGRGGATTAIDMTIKSLSENGYLSEVNKEDLVSKYGYHGRSFRVISLPPVDTST